MNPHTIAIAFAAILALGLAFCAIDMMRDLKAGQDAADDEADAERAVEMGEG